MEKKGKNEVKNPPTGACFQFWKSGQCSHKPCKFAHISSNKITKPKKKQSTKQGVFEHMLYRKQFRNQHQMRHFVLAALGEPIMDDVVLHLGTCSSKEEKKNGLGLLRLILNSPFKLNAGSRGDTPSFQRVIVPLCHLLTNTAFQNSCHISSLRNIYSAVHSEVSFFPRAIKCLELMLEGGVISINEKSHEPSAWDPSNPIDDVLLPMAKLHCLILSRVTDAIAQEKSHKIQSTLEEITDRFPVGIREVKEMLQRTTNILQNTLPTIEKLTPKDTKRLLMNIIKYKEEEEGEGPGYTCSTGPRHDNDKVDFREISIVPTQQEAMCSIKPYLPHNITIQSKYVNGEVDSFLDVHFRLLREDMLASVRIGVRDFFEENKLLFLGNKNRINISSVSLSVYRNVKVTKVDPTRYSGVGFEIEFDQPHNVQKMKSKSARKRFWEMQGGSRQLQKDSLICIAFNVIPFNVPDKIIFAVVVDKNIENLKNNKCKITIKLLDAALTTEIIRHTKLQSKNMKTESIMLQVRGHFFAGYESVLRSLQQHRVDTIPFIDVLLRNKGDTTPILPPLYLEPDIKIFDLSCILKKPGKNKLRLPIQEYTMLRNKLHEYEEDLLLDDTQIDAFALGLTKSVSLIQGPPGTGKTYVGVFIMQTLLNNSKSRKNTKITRRTLIPAPESSNILHLDPILCICYTNHALDQFLEELVEKGVPLKDIIRVGGRSRSEILSTRSLHNISFGKKTSTEYRKWKKLLQESDNLKSQIEKYSTSICSAKQLEVIKFIKKCYLDMYYELVEPEEEMMDIEGAWEKNESQELYYIKKWLGYTKEKKKEYKKSTKEKDINLYEILNQDTKKKGKEKIEQKWKEKEEKEEEEEDDDDDDDDDEEEDDEGIDTIKLLDDDNENYSIDVLLLTPDLWSLSQKNRLRLWVHWKEEMKIHKLKKLTNAIKRYEKYREEKEQLNNAVHLRTLKEARVVGFTTSGCAKYQSLLRSLQPRVVVCEEAGEVLESHILASITSNTEHLILIGDHMQLRPKVAEFNLSIAAKHGYQLDLSLFERLVNDYKNQPDSLSTLLTQRRMRPEISELIRKTLYPKLCDGINVLEHPPLLGFDKNLWFFNHNNIEGKNESQSYTNLFEAKMVIEIIRYAIRQGYSGDRLAVITPYVGQLLLLRKMLNEARMVIFMSEADLEEIEKCENSSDDDEEEEEQQQSYFDDFGRIKPEVIKLHNVIRLATVDNFQGEEADFVIVSTVRNNPHKGTGFLKISNRVNVMLSRAKHGMIILGSSNTISGCRGATMFQKIINHLEETNQIGNTIPLRCVIHNRITHIKNPYDFKKLAPDGGCNKACKKRLKCGHVCRRLCHPDDIDHETSQCNEVCDRLLPCGHSCKQNCFKYPCPKCTEDVSIRLNCGHFTKAKCGSNPLDLICKEKLNIKMPFCGHEIILNCGKISIINEIYSEGMIQQKYINKLNVLFSCTKTCNELMSVCNHPCQRNCGTCTFETLKEEIDKMKDDIKDIEKMKEINYPIKDITRKIHGICTNACGRVLFCGHQCVEKKCHGAKDCPPCKRNCAIRCDHSSCGKKCSETCIACAEPCTWSCTTCDNRKICSLPCGSPCIRLPCDSRCTRNLECGHQCPSVCGEPCPSKDYCRYCAPKKNMDMVVDFIMLSSLHDHDPNESPLIILRCGHAFTIESLDGHTNLKEYYMMNKEMTEWEKPIPLESGLQATFPSCPHCRQPINGRRYGRILNRAILNNAQRKFLFNTRIKVDKLKNKIVQKEKEVEKIEKKEKEELNIKSINMLDEMISRNVNEAKRIINMCTSEAPTRLVYSREIVAWMKLQEVDKVADIIDGPTLIPPSIQPIIEAKLILLLALRVKLRFLCHCWPKIKEPEKVNLRKRPSKKPSKREKVVLFNHNKKTQGEIVLLIYNQCKHKMKEILSDCEKGKTERLKCAALNEAVFVHYYMFEGISSMPFKGYDENKGEESLSKRNRQIKVMEEFEIAIKKLEASCEKDEAIIAIENSVKEIHSHIDDEFYEPVSSEEKKLIFKAMTKDVGHNIFGGYGGHWYECPNGHVYTIGECGGAMETSSCPECGKKVGGSSHRLEGKNKIADNFLKEVKNEK